MTTMARKLDGAALAATIRAELAPRAAAFAAAHGRPPGLSVVLAGSRPESEIYVRNKLKAVAEAGMQRAELIRVERDRERERGAGRGGATQRGRLGRRDSGAVAAPRRHGRATPSSACSIRSTPRRTSTASIPATSAGSCRNARRWSRARRWAASSFWRGKAFRCRAGTPSSSGAATSSASRWRCCCCIATPR